MDKALQNSTKLILRHLLSLVAVAVVLFSSCSVKNEIKEILGIPVAVEQLGNQRVNLFSSTVSNLCSHPLATDLLQSVKTTIVPSTLLTTTSFSTTILDLSCIFETEKRKHPHYNSLKIADSFPIFLLYRKLIL